MAFSILRQSIKKGQGRAMLAVQDDLFN